MTSVPIQAPEATASFNERLDILAEELELAVKWQRPCILLVVYSSEFVRGDVEAALENCLIDLGQKGIHLSARDRDPNDVIPYFKEFRDPARAVFLIDGFRWGRGEDVHAYSTLSLQWEYFVERQIRTVFWLTPSEIVKLAHYAPDFWVHRQRVIEFVESPKADQVLRQAMDSAWQGTGEYAAEYEDTDAKISLRESLLTDLPKGDEAVSIRANLLLTLGVLNWRNGDFEKADGQLQEALQIATKLQDNWFEAECFNALALIRSSTQRIDEAIDAYKQAIQLAPDQIFAWNNLGNLCAKIGRNDEAMIAFRKALQGNSRDSIAWNGLASLHFKLGYLDDAIAAHRKAIQYSPTFAQPWSGLGDVYASMGRADEALKCYHKAIELNKHYVAPWIRLAVLFTKQERHREAIKAYQRALALDPRNSRTWNELGLIHLKSGSLEEAATAFSKAMELDRGYGWAYSNLAHTYVQQGKPKLAVSLLIRSLDLLHEDADKATSWNRLAEVYRLLNDYDNAVSAYQMADQLRSVSSTVQPEDLQGDEPAAAKMSEQTPKAGANTENLVVTDGQSSEMQGPSTEPSPTKRQPETAGPPTGKVNSARTSDAPAWIFAAAGEEAPAGSSDSKSEPAAVVGERVSDIVTHPESQGPNAGEKPSVAAVAERTAASATAPQPAGRIGAAKWTDDGNAAFNRGAFDEAIGAYNSAIQVDPTFGAPYSNLALTYLTQGQFAEAILLYQKSIELLDSDKDKALSWNGLGNAYRCIDDYTNAVAAYQRAAELDPETSGIREQVEDYRLGQTPRNAQAWNDLGELFLQTGSLDKAADAFGKALHLEPESGLTYFNLARTLAIQGKYAEAEPLFQRSIDLVQDNKQKADAWNGLGNAYRKLNDYDRAINAYQKAVVLADEGVDLLTRTRFSLLSNCFVNQ
jgi:tetratricopeptide (TPR) repeat protein